MHEVNLTYLSVSFQHAVTGPAAQVPEPDRPIVRTRRQVTIRQHGQGGHLLQYRDANDALV